jgi:hypothetical protein
MRKKFLQGCLSAREARKRAPWAAVVVQADGGYWASRAHTTPPGGDPKISQCRGRKAA